MKKKGTLFLFGLVVIVSGWWIVISGSPPQPKAGVLDVWATYGDEPAQLQALFDRYGQAGRLPVRVVTRVRSDDLLQALGGASPPDLVILSGRDPVESYHQQGLIEPLGPWIEASGIDLDDIYPAPLAQCQAPDGASLCLPWGADVDALFWNKELFAAAGLDPDRPPQTMEELLQYAEKLSLRDQDGALSQVGFIPDYPRLHADLYLHLFGGSEGNADGAGQTANWQERFDDVYVPGDLKDFISSFTPYMASSHPVYAGRRLSCQQCHRFAPIQNKKTPDLGFFHGRIAMMIDAQWQVVPGAAVGELPDVSYGVAPFPPPADHPDRANRSPVQGPVVIIPAGALDKEAAADLLAWMMSPEIVADAADASAALPTSRVAAQDPRFRPNPDLELFLELMAGANTLPLSATASTK
jgi:multiple sugar transport system substrate-binding protein